MPEEQLLKEILNISSVSGDESRISNYIVDHIFKRRKEWKVSPKVFYGENFLDNVVLVFGNPTIAAFAHLDTVGFTARYENQLIPIGGPEFSDGTVLQGNDVLGDIECKVSVKDGNVFHDFSRAIQRGTLLSFRQEIFHDNEFIQSSYLDNRIGIYNLLRLAETLTDGILVFSTYEEHGGGSMPMLVKFIYEKWGIRKALISDVTWITDGIHYNQGAVISLRDSLIPRKVFLDQVLSLAERSGIPHQLEVEAYGGSDGREVQMSPYPIDWCFIGIPEEHPHSPQEKIALHDLDCMLKLYQYLMQYL